jgi:hypothetical protein
MGEVLDSRSRSLAGEPSWVRSNLEVYTHGSSLTSHDWLQLIPSASEYLLQGLFPDDSRKLPALLGLASVCRELLEISSPVDNENRQELNHLKSKIVLVLCELESVLPRTELAVMFHILLHVPDSVYRYIPHFLLFRRNISQYVGIFMLFIRVLVNTMLSTRRWNAIRNYWSFFTERTVGHFIRFVHNRDLAVENIVTAYVRHRVVLDNVPGAASDFRERTFAEGLLLPVRSLLESATDISVIYSNEIFPNILEHT